MPHLQEDAKGAYKEQKNLSQIEIKESLLDKALFDTEPSSRKCVN
jgi:hypothetical protein